MWAAIVFGLLSMVPAWAAGSIVMPMDITHRITALVLPLGVILLVARWFGQGFEKLRLPGVLGEVLGGILIGPYALGGLPLPGWPQGLIPPGADIPVFPELYGFCTVAAIVLLFTLGLDTDARLAFRHSAASRAVGLTGGLVAFLSGNLLTMGFSPWIIGHRVGFFSPEAIVLGLMTTATSVGITARILSKHHRLDSPESTTILSGAVIDDVLAVVLLAVGMGILSARGSMGRLGLITTVAIGLWLVVALIGRLLSSRISRLLKGFRHRDDMAIMALGIGLIVAGLFEKIGLATIVGAYVTGSSLAHGSFRRLVREKLEPVTAFFVPVLFVVIGMLVDPRLLFTKPVIVFAAVYTVVAIAAKVLGGSLSAWVCGFNGRGALRIGVGMVPRGEMTLIIGGLGQATGLIGPEALGVGVWMTLVTALVTPPVLSALVRNHRPDAPPSPADLRTTRRFPLPSREAADILTRRLLAVFDAEGFSVQTLHPVERIYQMRKDDTVISLRHDHANLIFDCCDRDVAFVHTAVFEVAADLRRLLTELRKPVDEIMLAKKAQEPMRKTRNMTNLADHLSRRALIPHLTGTTKAAIINELLDALRHDHADLDVATAREAVWARESTGSTGMPFGVALPHGRTDAVDRVLCAIGLHRTGIDFESTDGRPSRIIVLVLSPLAVAGLHVQFLAAISQVLSEEGCQNLLSCKTPEAMYDTLTRGRP